MSAYSPLDTVLSSAHELCTSIHNNLRDYLIIRFLCYRYGKTGPRELKQIYKVTQLVHAGGEAKLIIYTKDKLYYTLHDEINTSYHSEYKFYLLKNVVLKMIVLKQEY